jgi:hypothetical protein
VNEQELYLLSPPHLHGVIWDYFTKIKLMNMTAFWDVVLGSTLIFQMCILPSSSGSHCPDDGGNMPL